MSDSDILIDADEQAGETPVYKTLEPVERERSSRFVRTFDSAPQGLICPHFYELHLTKGCPYNCDYCYLRTSSHDNFRPILFTNPWKKIEQELESFTQGVFNTGERADSLAFYNDNTIKAIKYFSRQKEKYLLLLTKSDNHELFKTLKPSKNVIVSFSVNCNEAAEQFEHCAPPPRKRLKAARKLIEAGWRVRIRLDPVIEEIGLKFYKDICKDISEVEAERVTVGTLYQVPGTAQTNLFHLLIESPEGILRYPDQYRYNIYVRIAEWLGFEPSICQEAMKIWKKLGWKFQGCNCTE